MRRNQPEGGQKGHTPINLGDISVNAQKPIQFLKIPATPHLNSSHATSRPVRGIKWRETIGAVRSPPSSPPFVLYNISPSPFHSPHSEIQFSSPFPIFLRLRSAILRSRSRTHLPSLRWSCVRFFFRQAIFSSMCIFSTLRLLVLVDLVSACSCCKYMII